MKFVILHRKAGYENKHREIYTWGKKQTHRKERVYEITSFFLYYIMLFAVINHKKSCCTHNLLFFSLKFLNNSTKNCESLFLFPIFMSYFLPVFLSPCLQLCSCSVVPVILCAYLSVCLSSCLHGLCI